jgi:hypothetical protein
VVPKNTGGTVKDYTFSFSVKNATGTTKAANVVVGVGAAPPPISLTPQTAGSTLTFPAQGVGIQGVPESVTVTNNAKTTQDITGIGLAAGPDPLDFQVQLGNCIVYLTAGQSCDFQISFIPQAGGARTETVSVFDASWGTSGAAAKLGITGTGQFATASVSTTDLVFPSQGVDTTSSWSAVTVTNSGSVPLHLENFAVQGADSIDFGLLGNTCTGASGGNILSVGEQCTFEVNFTPSDSGTRSTTVTIYDNTASDTTTVAVQGTGAWTQSQLSTDTVTFAPTEVGIGVGQYVTIENLSSTVSLTFTGSTLTGTNALDFEFIPNPIVGSVQELCASPHLELGPLQSCEFEVAFLPTNTGTRTAQLTIYDNTDNATNPQAEVITLSGTGTPP